MLYINYKIRFIILFEIILLININLFFVNLFQFIQFQKIDKLKDLLYYQ